MREMRWKVPLNFGRLTIVDYVGYLLARKCGAERHCSFGTCVCLDVQSVSE